ncbi:MAG: methyltransferase domain-containing protein [Planctomycetes bacterium]|nr:methyltransferase domain-containing protein [Planctomycetota bacterium]
MDPEDIRRAYDRSAGGYDARFAALQGPKYDAVLARVDVPPGARVADLGGGTGLLARRLPPRTRRPVVVDFSRPMLAHAPSAADRVQGDLRRLPLRDASVDRAFAITALLLAPRARAGALLEVARVLAPGGRLALTVLADEAAGLEDDLRACGLRPGERFTCGQDVGWICDR